MTDDYRVKSRSDQHVRELAKKARAFFGVADHVYVDVLECLERGTIWTVRGEQRLNFQVRPDAEMGSADGSTIYAKNVVTIAVKESVREAAFMGVGRARNTVTHELGHGVMHDCAQMFRRADGNVMPKWLRPFESAEHQAKVFAPAFLINDAIARPLSSAVEISVAFGVSLESANIYYEQLTESLERAMNAERVRRLAQELTADFSSSDAPRSNSFKMQYMNEVCTVCSHRMVFPIGIKFMCHNCKTVFDRFQDGD
jgi:hypothetical protein